MKRYFFNLLLLLDCTIDSALFGGSPFETISSRVWRHRDNVVASWAVKTIDLVALNVFGQTDHCKKSEQSRCFYEGYEVLR